MRRCTKLVSVSRMGSAPLLSKCSACDSSVATTVSSTTTMQRNYYGMRSSPSTECNNRKMKTDRQFPSLSLNCSFRKFLQINGNRNSCSLIRRSYSTNKTMETTLMDSSTSGATTSSSPSSPLPNQFFGENTHNHNDNGSECGSNSHSFTSTSSSSCSIHSPCSGSTSSERLIFANRGGGDNNCGGSNNNNDCGVSSAISSSSSPSMSSSATAPAMALGTTTTSTTFGISSTAAFTPIRTVVTSQRLVEVGRDSIMEQPKLLSKEEREEFMSVYHELVKDLLEIPDMKDMQETNRWMARVLQYNVPHGKRNRGLYTAIAYKYFAPEELTEENVRLSYILGWCVEILQAFFLVSDDIMDESETRRGRPCWYKVDNLGLAAVNDAILLEAVIYQILRKHFSEKACYPKLMEVMHDVTYKTIFGQSLDTRTGQDRRMETYTMERYSSIVKYKTSYYSFYLPVALAMTLCDIKDPNLYQQARKVTLEMGHFFQVQDDYLDCFGNEEVTGKIGTDIQDCKCSWLFVTAVQRCNPDQKKFLLANYGINDPAKIEAVKGLYKELDLEAVYHDYEEQTYNLICTHIQQMNDELPKGLFYDMLHKIYKRSS